MANQHPPIPPKIKAFQHDKERKTRQEWERYLQQYIRGYQKMERREKDDGMLNAYDLSGPMLRRRTDAILNFMPKIYERYEMLSEATPNALGEEWVSLNTALCSYSYEEAQSHILFAAALWILDHINVAEAFPYLPSSDADLEETFGPNLWDAQHDYELILSVQYVLENRNGPPEDNGREYMRVITDRASAEGVQHTHERHRENFDALLELVPQELILQATKQFEDLFWQWTDQYFGKLKEMMVVSDGHRRDYEKLRVQFNTLVDDLTVTIKEIDKEEKEQKKAKKQTPLLVLAQPQKAPFSLDSSPAQPPSMSKSAHRISGIAQRMLRIQESMDDVFDKISECADREQAYVYSQVRPGGGTPLPLDGIDPYALCFALIYLIDTGSDLPWLYGPGVMLTEQITERLPWGIIEYDEDEDAIWWGGGEDEPYYGKPTQLPDWYERKYQKKDDFFPRSLVQLLYEETGCLMPRDLHQYDRRAKELGRYGVRGKDAQMMLTCMTALSNAKYQNSAVNLRPWEEPASTENTESEEGDEEIKELKSEIRRLKSALHDAERTTRDIRQELDTEKKRAAQELRELADLREIVFSQEQEEEKPEEAPQLELPYTVVKETLVFGGHDSWLKAFKPILKGNIRFIDRDYVFDTAIIRRAEAIWVQTNSISHKQYYRIVDTARQYKKPIRYFANASALKCAAQLIENDD